MLPAHFRTKATGDVGQAVEHYLVESEVVVATRFVDAVEETVRQLELHPELGSFRFAFELDVPGLPSFRVDGFSYLIFYLIRREHLDVLRVLHASRDVPRSLREL